MTLERDRLQREHEFARRRERQDTSRFRTFPDVSVAYADEQEIRDLQANIDRHTRPHSVAGVSGTRLV
ncbi:MAG: hypothetical protein BJ554DRAFT_3118 [Olpidium bornovanus]|uniref:Uncharacterized protein n=1 Tax=Olpidium bornovanus TaxID=278681 RepID=A0A8H7ZPA6_9FUNG|nr:MAG: hypothetical protein BJ554DRAFT_3118 [Olpidium bornovanus]